jgi:hypothetical protein
MLQATSTLRREPKAQSSIGFAMRSRVIRSSGGLAKRGIWQVSHKGVGELLDAGPLESLTALSQTVPGVTW